MGEPNPYSAPKSNVEAPIISSAAEAPAYGGLIKNIDVKGLLLGSLLALVGFVIIGAAYVVAKAKLVGPTKGFYTLGNLLGMGGIGLIIQIWSGFIISKVSHRGKILNPMIFGFIIMVISCFPAAGVPLWYVAASILLAMPSTYIGALIHHRPPRVAGAVNKNPASATKT